MADCRSRRLLHISFEAPFCYLRSHSWCRRWLGACLGRVWSITLVAKVGSVLRSGASANRSTEPCELCEDLKRPTMTACCRSGTRVGMEAHVLCRSPTTTTIRRDAPPLSWRRSGRVHDETSFVDFFNSFKTDQSRTCVQYRS